MSIPRPIAHKNLKWYDITDPDTTTTKFLAEKFRFHPLDLEDCLTENQRPKIDEYDRYLFIVLHFPIYNSKTRRVTTAELDIFIGQNFLVTLHDGQLPPLQKICDDCSESANARGKHFDRGTGYLLYKITSQLFDYCFPILDRLGSAATQLERNVFDSDGQRDVLREIMLLKKNIITFRRIIQPERPVISALEHKNKKFLPETLEVYFDDVVDKIEKLWSSLDSLKEVAETLQDANESLISHRTNDTIRVLTVFSVILLPLTLITGIFGMNVGLPQAENSQAFVSIVLGMVGIVVAMIAYFRWKRWL